jgi:Protein of unknown function (DUF2971)
MIDTPSKIKELEEWWKKEIAPGEDAYTNDQLIYHYTDVSGLKGIVENGHFWFTDHLHLNDPGELKFGLQCAAKAAAKVLPNPSAAGDELVRGLAIETIADLANQLVGIYLACFSEKPNDLGQWRAYADNGRGVALGMPRSIFAQLYEQHSGPGAGGFVGAKVVCGEDKCIERQELTLRKALELLPQGTADLWEWHKSLTHLTIWNALTCKHEAYEAEKEIRFIAAQSLNSQTHTLLTRLRASTLVPYIELKVLLKEKLKSVTIGPAAPPQAEDAIRKFLSSKCYKDITLSRSEIPYRG